MALLQTLRRSILDAGKDILYGRWPPSHSSEGYTILLLIPTDMPFLLQFALEGLRHVQTPNCHRIVVIPDTGKHKALDELISQHGDKRVHLAGLTVIDRLLCSLPRSDNSANYKYFTQVLRGLLAADTDTIYLHDADAFWLNENGVEAQYLEFHDRDLYALGVQRVDRLTREHGMTIPGTWEMFFSKSWVRRYRPWWMKNGWYKCQDGKYRWFDSMHYECYLDYESGKIAVMDSPPPLVHFSATITEYRCWQASVRKGHQFTDTLFRLPLLSVLSEAMPGTSQELPKVRELASGLTDPNSQVVYPADGADEYTRMRRKLEQVCAGAVFSPEAGRRIWQALAPFDEHFAAAERT